MAVDIGDQKPSEADGNRGSKSAASDVEDICGSKSVVSNVDGIRGQKPAKVADQKTLVATGHP
jgi:hypothetical protein